MAIKRNNTPFNKVTSLFAYFGIYKSNNEYYSFNDFIVFLGTNHKMDYQVRKCMNDYLKKVDFIADIRISLIPAFYESEK